MAVVKASFTKSRGGAKASVRYIMFRPGRDGEKIERQLFGHDGTLSLFQADTMINEAEKGTNFFRIVLSPDPAQEDTYKDLNLSELTQLTVLKLEDRLKREIQFVATEHNDHTPNRHIHMIALIPGKLGVADLEFLIQTSTNIALFQRQEKDLALAHMQGRGAAPERPFARTVYQAAGPPPGSNRPNSLLEHLLFDEIAENEKTRTLAYRSKPWSNVTVCHLCGKPAGKKAFKCYNCGARLAISLDLRDNGLGDEWDL